MLDTQGVRLGSLKAFIYKYGKYEILQKDIKIWLFPIKPHLVNFKAIFTKSIFP